ARLSDVPGLRDPFDAPPGRHIARFMAAPRGRKQPAAIHQPLQRADDRAARERWVVTDDVGDRERDGRLDDEVQAANQGVQADGQRIIVDVGDQPLWDGAVVAGLRWRGVKWQDRPVCRRGCVGRHLRSLLALPPGPRQRTQVPALTPDSGGSYNRSNTKHTLLGSGLLANTAPILPLEGVAAGPEQTMRESLAGIVEWPGTPTSFGSLRTDEAPQLCGASPLEGMLSDQDRTQRTHSEQMLDAIIEVI